MQQNPAVKPRRINELTVKDLMVIGDYAEACKDDPKEEVEQYIMRTFNLDKRTVEKIITK